MIPTGLPRVLIAEDDVSFAHAIARYMRGKFETHHVTDGQGILDVMDEFDPDVLLCDLRMPGLPSLQVIRRLRARVDRWHLPILMMTGDVSPELIAEAMTAGVDSVVEKPFLQAAILAKLNHSVQVGQLRRREAAQQAELARLHARRDAEAQAARAVLERMLQRGDFAPGEVRHVVMPAYTFAGDVVCASRTPSGAYRWMLGDVTGHTLASALVTLPISMLFYGDHLAAPLADAVNHLDRELGQMLPVDMFCAAAVCELDRAAGTLQIWNGGMPDVLVRARDGTSQRVASTAPPLAADRFSAPAHAVRTLPVEPGMRVYTMSDGITETQDARGLAWGLPAIEALLARPEMTFDEVLARWHSHVGAELRDDSSLIEVTV